MGPWTLPPELTALLLAWAPCLHSARLTHRLPVLFLGIFFTHARHTAATWFRHARVGKEFREYYYLLGALGRKSQFLACGILRLVLRRLHTDDLWLFALDDTPTQRYGPHVEGAGRHHHPSPGPADSRFLYGHVWVTLACVLRHRWWGVVALPLLAKLYVRQKDLAKIPHRYAWTFQTKLELAADLIAWLKQWLQDDKPVWLTADGAYAKRPVLRATREHEVVFFSRLRKDASLWSVPDPRDASTRGRPRLYGRQAFSLKRRAAHPQGWETLEVEQYGQRVQKTFKTFVATWRPAGGAIRVVLVREERQPEGWLAYFCTDAAMDPGTVLEVMTRRSAIEQTFKDVKEVEGAGRQQLRHIWGNVGAFHACLWAYTLAEWWAWDQPASVLVDRSLTPWDDPCRRPSHRDKRKALCREGIEQTFTQVAGPGGLTPEMAELVRGLIGLVG